MAFKRDLSKVYNNSECYDFGPDFKKFRKWNNFNFEDTSKVIKQLERDNEQRKESLIDGFSERTVPQCIKKLIVKYMKFTWGQF